MLYRVDDDVIDVVQAEEVEECAEARRAIGGGGGVQDEVPVVRDEHLSLSLHVASDVVCVYVTELLLLLAVVAVVSYCSGSRRLVAIDARP